MNIQYSLWWLPFSFRLVERVLSSLMLIDDLYLYIYIYLHAFMCHDDLRKLWLLRCSFHPSAIGFVAAANHNPTTSKTMNQICTETKLAKPGKGVPSSHLIPDICWWRHPNFFANPWPNNFANRAARFPRCPKNYNCICTLQSGFWLDSSRVRTQSSIWL